MISVASLLNPANSEVRITNTTSSPSSRSSTPTLPFHNHLAPRYIGQRPKMAKDGAIFNPGKTKGEVVFPPFEDLDDCTVREIEKYQIYPLGQISRFPRHIPYNSDKKNFLEKTSRESFEVFQYEFKLVGEEKTYTVMWDYNIGLVRITPFFKCCKYSKTTPAKMLNLNPGLKEITHSITGGALVAQGYWMPYSCALAVCATFCAHISGALIPIFGPDFPAQCIPTTHQSYGTMIIEPSVIVSATAEAKSFRQQYTMVSPTSSIVKFSSASPGELLRDARHLRPQSPTDLGPRFRLKRTYTNSSMYTTDAENSDTSMSSRDRYPCSPVTPTSSYESHGWTYESGSVTPIPKVYPQATAKRLGLRTNLPSFNAQLPSDCLSDRSNTYDATQVPNHNYGHRTTLSCGASPWLSAIPRSINSVAEDTITLSAAKASSHPEKMRELPNLRRSARRAMEVMKAARTMESEMDKEYDGEDDGGDSPSGSERSRNSGQSDSSGGTEKKAAWLLMNLSVRDVDWAGARTVESVSPGAEMSPISAVSSTHDIDTRSNVIRENYLGYIPGNYPAPRVKRRRATSL